MRHLREFRDWTSTSTDGIDGSYDYVPSDKSDRTYYGLHDVKMQYNGGPFVGVTAKFDTGASSSSISMEVAKKLGIPEELFGLAKEINASDKEKAKKLASEHGVEFKAIKNATGKTYRMYVPLTINFDGHTITTAANLIDRSGLKAEALIGLRDMN